jgi:hypothetical protein
VFDTLGKHMACGCQGFSIILIKVQNFKVHVFYVYL